MWRSSIYIHTYITETSTYAEKCNNFWLTYISISFFTVGVNSWCIQLECTHFCFIGKIHLNTEIRDQNQSPSKVVTFLYVDTCPWYISIRGTTRGFFVKLTSIFFERVAEFHCVDTHHRVVTQPTDCLQLETITTRVCTYKNRVKNDRTFSDIPALLSWEWGNPAEN